ERDLRTILNLAEGRDIDTGIVEGWIENSGHRKEWCWRVLRQHLLVRQPQARIAVLGLAYKEDTHSTKNAPSLALLARLRDNDVTVHDPVVPASAAPFARGCPDPLTCADGADALVICTPWPEYRAIAISELSRVMRGRLFIDPFRVLNGRVAAAAGFAYHALGMPPLSPQ